MSSTVGILGSGAVGQTLARGLRNLDYDVMLSSRDGKEIDGWDGKTGKFEDAAKSDLIVLAIKGSVAHDVVKSLKADLDGKTIVDATNPIADAPPDNGVIKFFTNLDASLMEGLQTAVPKANFVKAFNSVGAALMVNPRFDGIKPTMFICGNNGQSKKIVGEILNKLGWETVDMGKAEAARAIEPLCMLWCIPGILNNQWSHAFKLLQS
jgi:hypothetical protein